jgi:hypothetical protein
MRGLGPAHIERRDDREAGPRSSRPGGREPTVEEVADRFTGALGARLA